MKNRSLLAVILIAVLHGTAFTSPFPFRLAPLFTDNMVLQQRQEVPIFGRGAAGSSVTVKASWGASAETVVDTGGVWNVPLRTPKAGGPYTLELRNGDTSIVLKNVLIGEVWLCGGQSNMEMPLQGWPPNDTIAGAQKEIQDSTHNEIRLYTVTRRSSLEPLSTCVGQWAECSPTTAPTFSATAYFFGTKLYEKLHVPIGLIHSSWGGTPIEAWTSAGTLREFKEFDSTFMNIGAAKESLSVYEKWLDGFPTVKRGSGPPATRWVGLGFDDDSCKTVGMNDSSWHLMNLPAYWEGTEMGNFDGTVWFRRTVEIPQGWVGRNLVLELGPIDDMDITYVNGVRVGGYEVEGGWKVNRTYPIPASSVTDSILHLAVRVLDNQGGGGIWGNGQRMCIHPAGSDSVVAIDGAWRYLPVADLVGDTFYVFGERGDRYFSRPHLPIDIGPSTPTTLYNGMIAPLAPFAVRGVIWYQGESNIDHPFLYARLFPAMIQCWRDAFHLSGLPFYYVQIAPYAYQGGGQSQYLREAQREALRVKNTGMAVTLDIGNFENIHPADKRDVGDRLARWALAKTYNKNVVCSGPLPTSVKRTRKYVEVRFAYAGRGLVLRDTSGGSGFQIAGKDSVFRDARARIVGDRIQLSCPDLLNPQAVRYAFSNTPTATLFNREGLPAPSFRTDTWNPQGSSR
ncbi:MAG: sialate O-acetylesterase [Bacteroidota bacterium]